MECDARDNMIQQLNEAHNQFAEAHEEYLAIFLPGPEFNPFTWAQKSDEALRKSAGLVARANKLLEALTKHGFEHGCYGCYSSEPISGAVN